MVESIITQLGRALEELPFLSKVGGLSQTQFQGDKRYPVARTISNDCIGDYKDMLPSSKEIGIAFFEQIANSITERVIHRTKHRATINLVVWYNLWQIEPQEPSLIEAHIIKQLLSANLTENIPEYIKNVKIELLTTADYNNPYSKYTLREEETQYKMHPYQSFSISIGIDYFFIDSCLPAVTVNALSEC